MPMAMQLSHVSTGPLFPKQVFWSGHFCRFLQQTGSSRRARVKREEEGEDQIAFQ